MNTGSFFDRIEDTDATSTAGRVVAIGKICLQFGQFVNFPFP
jgi:hypothetical protein